MFDAVLISPETFRKKTRSPYCAVAIGCLLRAARSPGCQLDVLHAATLEADQRPVQDALAVVGAPRAAGQRVEMDHDPVEDAVACRVLREVRPPEQRVAELIGSGASNRGAADALFISVRTVETHVAAIYRKLGVRSRAEVAKWLADTSAD